MKRLVIILTLIVILGLCSGGLAPGPFRASAQQGTPGEWQASGDVYISPPVFPADTRGLPPAPTIQAMDSAAGNEPPAAPLLPHLKPPRQDNLSLPPVAEGEDTLVQVQDLAPAAEMPGLLASFQGISNPDGFFPPDPSGAVGKDHFVQMVNVSTRIYDKQGHPLYGPFHPSSLWPYPDPCNRMNDGDVVVLYDQLADRWLLTQFAIKDGLIGGYYYECIAVSKGPVPTNVPGDWYLYSFPVHATKMNDYPKLGIWPDGYYMTANQFEGGISWGGVGVWVFERDKMLAGQATTYQYRDLHSSGIDIGTLLPANLLGMQEPPAGAPAFALTVEDGTYTWDGQAEITVLEISARWPGGMTVSVANHLHVAPFNWLKQYIPQKDTNIPLDSISDRLMMHTYYRNLGSYEALVANHTVDAGGGRAGIRWYELRKYVGQAVWQVYQQGTYAPPDAVHRWMGSLAMDSQGNLALGYSVSGTDLYPGVRYTGRLASDPLGTMAQGEGVMVNGNGYQTRTQNGIGRWGDYTAMSVDPVDDCTFWYTNEYLPVSGNQPWSTWIGAFKFPGCAPVQNGTITGQVTNSQNGQPVAGASVSGLGNQAWNYFQATSGANGMYTAHAAPGNYEITAAAFGYAPRVYEGVVINPGTTTTRNAALNPAPVHQLSIAVRDAQAGWPLYARIQIDGYPGAPVWTDPQSGTVSITLPEFVTYTLQVGAFLPGYLAVTRAIGYLTSNLSVEVNLQPDLNACTAPGYIKDSKGCQWQHGGLVIGNVTDANTLKALNGAVVSASGGGSVLSVPTVDDPAVGDGLYILFTPNGTQVLLASHSQYTTQSKIVSVPPSKAVRQDFSLLAGLLSIQPLSLAASAEVGEVVMLNLSLENNGGAPAYFSITERDPAFAPASLIFRRSYNPPQENTDNSSATRRLETPVGRGVNLHQLDLETITGHVCLLGIEYALGSYWVTSGGQSSCSDPNYLLQVSLAGEVLNSYEQPGSTTFGWGDLAFDGMYLYASDSSAVQQINPQTGQATGVTIPGPVSPVRALAYDPASDHFWMANQTSGIYEVDRAGTVLKRIPGLMNIYGLAYDPTAPGGAAVWAWSQDGEPQVLANRIDPVTGKVLASFMGVAFSGTDQAGGATFTDALIPGKRVLLTLHQAAADSVVGYDLGPVYATDMPWITPNPEAGTIGANSSLPLQITLQSYQAGILKADILVQNDTPYGTLSIPVTFTVAGITLTSPSSIRTALPGSTIAFPVMLSNGTSNPEIFDLSLGHSMYSSSLSQTSISAGGWETGLFQVLVHVPAGSVSGDQDQVTVQATRRADPNFKLTLTLVTQVDIRYIFLPNIYKSR